MKILKYVFQCNLLQILNRLKSEMPSLHSVVKYLPHTLILDVTTECNLCCAFCSTDKYRKIIQNKSLSYDVAKKILSKFKMADFVGFCGAGEPLLNDDLFKMIKYAKDLRMRTYMTTNGLLIEDRSKEILLDPPDFLEISLKEINDDKYRSITKNKSFKLSRMLESIEKLAVAPGRPKKIVLSYVCDRDRVLVAPEVIAIARKLKIDEVWFGNLIPDPLLRNHEKCLFEADREWLKSIFDFESNRAFVKGPRLYSHDTSIRKCQIPFKSIRVGCDGGISACPRSICPRIEYGNALTDDDVFNAKHFQELRSERLNPRLPLRYECIYCDGRLPE
jgi:MoaA/NifB/PqqE/SkfB family radical SAM enzyme